MDRLVNEDKFIVWVCMGMYWYVFLFVRNYGQTSKKLDVFFSWASTISHTVALKSRSPMESRQLLDKETSICSTIGLRLVGGVGLQSQVHLGGYCVLCLLDGLKLTNLFRST